VVGRQPSDRISALVIETLADDEASLRADVVSYRALACAAITALHDVTRELAAKRRQLAELRDELRRYVRAQVSS
jgi:hypothetical protein